MPNLTHKRLARILGRWGFKGFIAETTSQRCTVAVQTRPGGGFTRYTIEMKGGILTGCCPGWLFDAITEG